MTDAPEQPPSPGYIPGRPAIGYGMTPGVHHNTMTGRDDMTGDPEPVEQPAAPLLAGGPPPEKINLDAPDGAPAPKPPTMRGKPIGWQILNDDGSVLAEFHNVNTADYQRKQVEDVGKALVDQAVSPDDKEAANRALAYGLAMVGTIPASEITKRMAQRYDTDERNSISRSIQQQKNARRGLGGGGGPVGPSKADKFDNDQEKFDAGLTEQVVNNTQAQSKVAALHEMESDLDKLESMVSSKDPLAQRAAVMEYMKTLSGKQSTDVERRNLANANGIIDALVNNVSLWTTDPSLTKGYVQQFKNLVGTLRATVAKRKAQIGKEASDRITHQPRFVGKDPATKKKLGDYAQGVLTGDYNDKPAVDPDLLK